MEPKNDLLGAWLQETEREKRAVRRPAKVPRVSDRESMDLYALHCYFNTAWVYDNESNKREFRPVHGNDEVRLLAFLMWLADRSVVIRGESGSGKSVMANAIVSLLFGDSAFTFNNPDLVTIQETSEKGMLTKHMEQKMKVAKRFYVPEYQNAAKNQEPLFKVLMERRTFEYNRFSNTGEGDNETIKVEPRALLTTLADGNEQVGDLSVEMVRRLIPVTTFSSKPLNSEVMHAKARKELDPRTETEALQAKVAALRAHVQYVMDTDTPVLNPCADAIVELLPPESTVSNSVIDYLFDLVKIITRFYWRERKTVLSRDGTECLVSSLGDNYVAARIGAEIFSYMCWDVHPLAPHILKVVPLSDELPPSEDDNMGLGGFVDKRGQKEKSIDTKHIDLICSWLKSQGLHRPKRVIQSILKRMVDVGIIQQPEKSKNEYYKIEERNFVNAVNWNDVWESSCTTIGRINPKAREAFERYGKSYLDPFTGATKEITAEASDYDRVYTNEAMPRWFRRDEEYEEEEYEDDWMGEF